MLQNSKKIRQSFRYDQARITGHYGHRCHYGRQDGRTSQRKAEAKGTIHSKNLASDFQEIESGGKGCSGTNEKKVWRLIFLICHYITGYQFQAKSAFH